MRKSLVLLSLLLVSQGMAEDIPEVQVTATRVEVPIEHVGDDVEVITKEEIEKYSFTSIADVLKYVAGVYLTSNGGFGQLTEVYMLGLRTKYIVVMINGIPINDPSFDNQANFAYIDLSNIEKIEVLKGPQSALYGSEAIAGVINIITKKPKKSQAKLTVEGGKYGTLRERLSYSEKLKKGFVSLSLEGFYTEGFSTSNEKAGSYTYEPDNDSYKYFTTWLNYGFDLDNLKINGNFKFKKAKADYDAGDSNGNTYVNYKNLFGSFNAKFIATESLLVNTKFGINSERRDYYSSNTSEYKGNTYYLTFQPTYYVNDKLFVSVGTAYKKESANIDSPYSKIDNSVNTKSIFSELHSDYFNLHTTLTVRRDFHSEFGVKTTYKVSTAYEIKETGTTIKGQLGTGFKAPTIYQLYDPTYGNEDLKPEKSRGYIVGVNQKLKKTTLEVNYFKNKLNDVIVWNYTVGYENAGSGWTEGVEVKTKAKLMESLLLNLKYTHTATSSELKQRIPSDKYTLGLTYKNKKTGVSFWIEHYSERKDKDYSTYPAKDITLEAFTTLNCYASYKLNDRTKLYLKGVNLTDEKYELAYGYNTMGRSIFAGVDITFK